MIKLPEDNYKIILIGCGGTGSQLLPSLMQICSNVKNVKEIILVDGDFYEPLNLKNQRCTLQDINKNKAQVNSERYKMIYPNLNIKYSDSYITSPGNIYSFFNNSNDSYSFFTYILIGAVDNNASRKVMHNYFNSTGNVIYIDSGNDSGKDDTNRNGQVIVGAKIRKEVLLPDVGTLYKEIKENEDDIKNVGTCMRISDDYPQNLATNMMAANVIASILTNILMFNKIENNISIFDADKLTIYSRI